MSTDVFRIREIAAKHKIDPRTLKRALAGKLPRGTVVRERATAAVNEYNRQTKKGPSAP